MARSMPPTPQPQPTPPRPSPPAPTASPRTAAPPPGTESAAHEAPTTAHRPSTAATPHRPGRAPPPTGRLRERWRDHWRFRWRFRWRYLWPPLAVWFAVVLISTSVVAQLESIQRHGLTARFRTGTAAATDFTRAFVLDRISAQRQQARLYLSGPTVTSGDLRRAATGLRSSVAGASDGRGRLLAVTPFAPGLIGRDQTGVLEHVRIAAREDRPGISPVTMSPALRRAAIGISVPFRTPYGRRIFSGALTVQNSLLGLYLERTGARLGEHIRVIDRVGNLVAAGDDPAAGARITSLEREDPALARALAGKPSGRYRAADGTERVYASAPATGTGWRLVSDTSASSLYEPMRSPGLLRRALLAGVAVFGLGAAVLLAESRRRRATAERSVRLLNEELRWRSEELERSNEDLRAFSYSVAHDLRAPLRAMSGYSEMLADDYRDRLDDTGLAYTRRIRLAASRMAKLIDDLLLLARVSRADLHTERVDLSAMAYIIAGELSAHEPERDVEFSVAEGITALADAELIRTVLANLLGNAWKFTSREGTARIEFGVLPADPGEAGCFVRDNGVGFDPAQTDKLFQQFHRLHDIHDYPGTGIGLANARRIIERHGGRIWAEGRPGQGATFSFTLPKAPEPTAAEPTAAEPTAAEPTAAEPTAAEPTAAEPTDPRVPAPTTDPPVSPPAGEDGSGR